MCHFLREICGLLQTQQNVVKTKKLTGVRLRVFGYTHVRHYNVKCPDALPEFFGWCLISFHVDNKMVAMTWDV